MNWYCNECFWGIGEKCIGSRELSRKAKMEVYYAMVVPMMTYMGVNRGR